MRLIKFTQWVKPVSPKAVLFNGKSRRFAQFCRVLPKQRFILGKTQVPTLHMVPRKECSGQIV